MRFQHPTLSVAAVALTALASAAADTITFVNQCSYDVWPAGAVGDSSSTEPSPAGFYLPSGTSQTLSFSSHWNGRWWGRTGCNFDSAGKGSCATGDCFGNLNCAGSWGNVPTTLAEFNNDWSSGNYYDISMVDGFNVPMSLAPNSGDSNCVTPTVATDINTICPKELAQYSNGQVVACMSACTAFGTAAYCCTGQYNGQNLCSPSGYSEWFRSIAPTVYSYAYDTQTYYCKNDAFTLTFCPSGAQDDTLYNGQAAAGSAASTDTTTAATEAATTGATTAATSAATTAAAQTSAPTTAAAQPQTTTQKYLSATNTSPPSAGRANINFYQDTACQDGQEQLTQVAADGSTCIPTSTMGFITVLCGQSGAYEIKVFSDSTCSTATEVLDGESTSVGAASTCATDGSSKSGYPSQSQVVTCGVMNNQQSGSPQQTAANGTVAQPTSVTAVTAVVSTTAPATTQAATTQAATVTATMSSNSGTSTSDNAQTYSQVSTNELPDYVNNAVFTNGTIYNATSQYQDGITFRPTLYHNTTNNAWILHFGLNQSATNFQDASAITYVIAHYIVDSNPQQNHQLAANLVYNDDYAWQLVAAPTKQLNYSFTVGRGYQFDTQMETVNATYFVSQVALPGTVAYLS